MSQFVLYSLAYPDSLHDYYQKIQHLPGFVLLESTDHTHGRYDIISARPYDYLCIDDNAQDLPGLLKKISKILAPVPSVAELPFQGGALGYISYDLGAKLLGIDATPQPSLSNMPLLELGLYDWGIVVDHHLKEITLFSANTLQSTIHTVNEVLELWHQPSQQPCIAQTQSAVRAMMTQDEYSKAFAAIHQFLKEGRSYQVNLTQPFQIDYEGDSWSFYRNICRKNPVPFASFLRTTQADILSFSPERFLFHEQGQLITSPIKGTIGRSSIPREDELLKSKLVHCEKNRAENVMIVDLLRNDLGKIALPGSVKVTHLCELESYNSVHHLVSTIEAQCLPTLLPFDLFLSCFPGGSITGAPKIESMHIIQEQETFARGVYCGSIGYFSRHGRFDTNIAIRTITAKENILHLAAGGGIVIDSDCEGEYRECFIKIAAVINGLKSI